MEKYLGVKLISAEPMTLAEYNSKFNRIVPATNGEEGYKVIYEDGYTSWSPKEVFEKAYRHVNNLTFGLAIEALKQGKRVAREGWNGKGMFLYLVKGTQIDKEFLRNEASNQPTEDHTGVVTFLSHIDMFTAQKTVNVGWLASQTDMLAEDWIIIE